MSLAVIHTKKTTGVQEDQNWFHNTLLSMGDAIIATDEEGKVIFVNPIAEELTGWTHKAAVGKDIATIYQAIDENSGEAVTRLLVDIAQGEDVVAVKVEMELIARDGSHLSIGDSAGSAFLKFSYSIFKLVNESSVKIRLSAINGLAMLANPLKINNNLRLLVIFCSQEKLILPG